MIKLNTIGSGNYSLAEGVLTRKWLLVLYLLDLDLLRIC
jgi:hypothetical protein